MRSRAMGLGLLVLAIGPPAGYAVAQSSGEPDVARSVPAAECPEASAAFAAAGMKFDTFVPKCPEPSTVADAISMHRQAKAMFNQAAAARDDATSE
jgi:hypothetical protein